MKLNHNDYSIEEMYCNKCNGNTLGMIMHNKEVIARHPNKWRDGVAYCMNCNKTEDDFDDNSQSGYFKIDSVEKHIMDERKGFDTYNRVNKIIAELREYADHDASTRIFGGYFPDLHKMSKQQLMETIGHLMGTAKMFKEKLDKNNIKLLK